VLARLSAALILLLSGCADPGSEAVFDTYLNRLERPLGTPAPTWEPAPTPRPPRPAQLHIPIARERLGALDFLALRGCELQVTIGKRNSSLGRLAAPSQTLLLELEFLRLAPACIQYLEDEGREALAAELAAALDNKRRGLPERIYNATLATEEFRALWKPPYELKDYPKKTSSAPVSALAAINAHVKRWLAGDYRADNRDFEILLSEVAKGDAGSLLAALSLQEAGLEAASAMLRSVEERGGLCKGSLVPPEVDIFKNVVEKFFIRGVQPRAASLGSRGHDLLPPVHSLEAQLESVLPVAYREWRTQRDAALAASRSAPRKHVEQVQGLLEQCRQKPQPTPLQTATSQR